ncbi:acyl-CoA dehydrogenase family protein [Alcaligenaceae bacterium]|nr:acyl-CoA dehydrogenase family protein [Alcaligenaceae bacterium]
MSFEMMQVHSSGLGPECDALRNEVRIFVQNELTENGFVPQCDSWLRGFDKSFSRKLGARGWLGMTWPKAYGGYERSPLERFVVIEELLAAGAPVAAHWIAERQMGPSVLRYGTHEQKNKILPGIASGDYVIAAGYSEPDVGSDLASVRTRAERVTGGWQLNGTKVWSSHAHHADFLFVLCRTEPASAGKHEGLSILMVALPAPGVTIRPIPLLTGEHHFNEVIMQDVFVPDDMLLGQSGQGWQMITSELVLERSGPERFMSTFPLLVELVRRCQAEPENTSALVAVGELVARFEALRILSVTIAKALENGNSPGVEAAVVKDMGTRFESDVTETARLLFPVQPSWNSHDTFTRYVAQSVMHSPAFTLRGGANEVLRGIIARGLGMR